MPAPLAAVVAAALFDCGPQLALPPPLPLLTSCRESRSAPLSHHSFLAPSSAYCDLTEPGPAGDADAGRAIVLTSPAATYKEQGREISGLCRAFSRHAVPLPVDSAAQPDRGRRAAGAKLLPRHPPLVPSKSSPALHRSPSKSPPPLPVHAEEPADPSQQHEDKQYSPSDSIELLSSSTQSTSQSALASSSPSLSSGSPFLVSSSYTVFSPSAYRSVSAHSVPARPVPSHDLSAHVNPFHSQAGSHRSLTASHAVRGRQLRVSGGRKDKDDVEGRTASTASTCSLASSSLSAFASPSLRHARSPFLSHASHVDNDNEADVDSDSDSSDGDDAEDHHSLAQYTPSRSPPSHFTFSASLSLQASASFSSSSSSTVNFSPPSPLFDTSLSGGRHSADPQFSAGIGVFAGQLQALRRLRSANQLTSPVSDAGSDGRQ